ncbi:purine-cytosine permease family protein [Pseudomonas sp. NPDC089401]|uniref:purine-cytosine permease family protein n=1 Tax=Pseudomonas sp. NPDC089401 TaxID=3364462 RepID=UPI00381BB4F6
MRVTYEDDPRVQAEQALDDYSRHVVPLTARTGRWSLAMTMWAVLSALFYLYISVAVAQAVGTLNAIVGMVVSVAVYGVINYVIALQAIRNGLTVGLLSRGIFGNIGGVLTSLLFGVTTLYFAVFEGSIIAVALQQYVSPESDIRWWYLLVVLYALPLVIGGVQVWLDKLNGALLPLCVAGLVMIVVAAGQQHGFSSNFLTIPATRELAIPGWLWSVVVYMGVFVNMMFTADFSRFGKPADTKFHGLVTFGPVFYVALFLINGVAGIFLMNTVFPGLKASEHGIAEAILNVSGLLGLIFIIASQTRINSANYYLASVNLQGFAARAFGIKWPRLAWVGISGVLVYMLMLTNVFSYLLRALAWQGVAVTAWVAIVLTHYAMARNQKFGPEFRPGRVKHILPGAWALLASTAFGIGLIEFGNSESWYVLTAPILIALIASAAYALATTLGGGKPLHRLHDPRESVDDVWKARIECHVCNRSYTALEMDCDPTANQSPICAGCAEGNTAFLRATRDESSWLLSPVTGKLTVPKHTH